MKWIKRLLLVIAIGLLGAILFSAGSWYLLQGEPEWYVLRQTPEQRAEAARRADQKVLSALSWAADAEAYENRLVNRNPASTAPASSRPSAHTITITQSELNAFFGKWTESFGWDERYGQYLSQPAITLLEGRLVLAGTVKELNAVVSLHFKPELTEGGQLDIHLARVMGGRLPLPEALWSSQRDRLERKLHAILPQLQHAARIKPNGASNMDAVGAAVVRMALNVLDRAPSDAVLFLPILDHAGGETRSVPVKLTDVQIENDTLIVTVEPMDRQERDTLLHRLRAPYQAVVSSGR